MVNLSGKEEVGHRENIKRLKLNLGYENIENLYNKTLGHYKDSRIRIFVPIFVMRDVLETLKTSLN